MRVVYLSWLPDPRGRGPDSLLAAWPTLRDVPAALAAAGLEVLVVQAATYDATFDRGGVSYRFVRTLRWRHTPWGPGRLVRAVAAARPDVIHAQGVAFPLETMLLCHRLRGVPVLAQDHGGIPPSGVRRLVYRRGLRGLAGVAFTAREQAEPWRAAGVLAQDLPVFEVLESSSHFGPGNPVEARAATGLHGDPCLLWIGRLNPNKDPLTVLEAFRVARARLTDARLWCYYTDAPLLAALRQRIAAERELIGRVHLMGSVPHERVELLCRAADFLLLGSHTEGSGYAVLEALACGTTPLVTDIPPFRRITAQGRFGALSPPGDVVAMAQAIVDWAGRDGARLRAEARAHFERALSFPVVAAELRAAYEALLTGS